MSLELCSKMFTMDDAFEFGKALQVANNGKGRISIKPCSSKFVISLVS